MSCSCDLSGKNFYRKTCPICGKRHGVTFWIEWEYRFTEEEKKIKIIAITRVMIKTKNWQGSLLDIFDWSPKSLRSKGIPPLLENHLYLMGGIICRSLVKGSAHDEFTKIMNEKLLAFRESLDKYLQETIEPFREIFIGKTDEEIVWTPFVNEL